MKLIDSNSAAEEKILQAQAAFANNNSEASIQVHKQKIFDPSRYCEDPPLKKIDYFQTSLKCAMNGTISSNLILSSLIGLDYLPVTTTAFFSTCFVCLQALANATQKWFYLKNEDQVVKREMTREFWEYENYPEGEKNEMIEIYEKKGLSKEEATELVNTLCKNTANFIDTMMVEELGILPPNPHNSPIIQSVHSYCGFLFGGLVPVLTYLFATSYHHLNPSSAFAASLAQKSNLIRLTTGINSLSLFSLGSCYSYYSTRRWWETGSYLTIQGALASFFAFYLGGLLRPT